jgi:hypothetical protein
VEQGLAIKQFAQTQEGLDTQVWHRRIAHVAAHERIEHPRGNGELKAILEFDNEAIRSLTS